MRVRECIEGLRPEEKKGEREREKEREQDLCVPRIQDGREVLMRLLQPGPRKNDRKRRERFLLIDIVL